MRIRDEMRWWDEMRWVEMSRGSWWPRRLHFWLGKQSFVWTFGIYGRFALQWGGTGILSWEGHCECRAYANTPLCCLWCDGATVQAAAVSAARAVCGQLQQPGTWRGLHPLFDIVVEAATGRKRQRTQSCCSSHLCQVLGLSSSGSLLCLFCSTCCLELQLSLVHTDTAGVDQPVILIIRFANT